MKTTNLVRCVIQGYQQRISPIKVKFTLGNDLRLFTSSPVGPFGVSSASTDLLDVAATVFELERQYSYRGRTNPPETFDVSIPLREPSRWTQDVIEKLQRLLVFMGHAQWRIEIAQRSDRSIVQHAQSPMSDRIRKVVLFSGGLDSTCGAATMANDAAETRLVSFYGTHQKTAQQKLARSLGFTDPIQSRLIWNGPRGRGRTFRYRSFLFLSLGAAMAESWGATDLIQFENGILATAIPPTPAWSMTLHAHPRTHQLMAEFLRSYFGHDWTISNPFLKLTKRDCVLAARESIGASRFEKLAKLTETCWFHWSNNIWQGKKKPGTACGVCIPCVLRRTALPGDAFCYDLGRSSVKNHRLRGLAFRSYYGFLEQVLQTKGSPAKFYTILPDEGRNLVGTWGALTLEELQGLFVRFASQFTRTFGSGR